MSKISYKSYNEFKEISKNINHLFTILIYSNKLTISYFLILTSKVILNKKLKISKSNTN